MKPIVRESPSLVATSAPRPQPVETTATPCAPESSLSDPSDALIAPRQAELLHTLACNGGTGTTVQLGQIKGIAPRTLLPDAEALAALGLVTLQQHPLLPNHATLVLTHLGRRVVDDIPDREEVRRGTSGRSHPRLALLPDRHASIDSA